MVKYDHQPKATELPSFVDQGSFSYILNLYKQLKDEHLNREEGKRHKKFRISRAKSTSIKTIAEIAKQPQLKHIYQGTRDYMV